MAWHSAGHQGWGAGALALPMQPPTPTPTPPPPACCSLKRAGACWPDARSMSSLLEAGAPFPTHGMFSVQGDAAVHGILAHALSEGLSWADVEKQLYILAHLGGFSEAFDTSVLEATFFYGGFVAEGGNVFGNRFMIIKSE